MSRAWRRASGARPHAAGAALPRRAAGWVLAAVGGAALAGLPAIASPYLVYLASVMAVQALFATSLNLVLGFGGMLQLHQGAFFGLGAYAVALAVVRGLWPFGAGLVLAPVVGAAAAWAVGWLAVRLRGLYFGMMTLALGQLFWAVVYRWYSFTGGDDGIHGIPIPPSLASLSGSFYLVVAVTAVALWALRRLVDSPFGLALTAIRDNPQRAESVGIDVRRHRLAALSLAGLFSGLAGGLFVVVERSVSPGLLFWPLSAEALIMCLLGGLYTFWGPTVGAVAIVMLRTYLDIYTQNWLLVLGLLLLAVVLFLPDGLLGHARMRGPAGLGDPARAVPEAEQA